MTACFDELLRVHGAEAEVTHEGETAQVRAFVQRILKKETEAPEVQTNFGAADQRHWLYLGPKGQALSAGDSVSCGTLRFVVQTAEAIFVGQEQTHWWALLRTAAEVLA